MKKVIYLENVTDVCTSNIQGVALKELDNLNVNEFSNRTTFGDVLDLRVKPRVLEAEVSDGMTLGECKKLETEIEEENKRLNDSLMALKLTSVFKDTEYEKYMSLRLTDNLKKEITEKDVKNALMIMREIDADIETNLGANLEIFLQYTKQ